MPPTNEPASDGPGDRGRDGDPLFVVQKHRARRLHYDLRLEIGGALVSWAVPKGPSLDPSQKRLAMPTEDHPMEYASFEGVIPEGEYGAGAVIVWDTGTYRNLRTKGGAAVPMSDCLEEGRIEIELSGTKLRGAFALFRTAEDASGRARWLLVKKRDAHAVPSSDITAERPESALSGRMIDEIAG